MWLGFTLLEKFLLVAGLIAGLTLAYAGWHHHVYQQGRDDLKAEIVTANAKRAAAAQQQIQKNGVAYEKVRQKIRAQQGYNLPVSPLVGSAIDGLYRRAAPPSKRSSSPVRRASPPRKDGH